MSSCCCLFELSISWHNGEKFNTSNKLNFCCLPSTLIIRRTERGRTVQIMGSLLKSMALNYMIHRYWWLSCWCRRDLQLCKTLWNQILYLSIQIHVGFFGRGLVFSNEMGELIILVTIVKFSMENGLPLNDIEEIKYHMRGKRIPKGKLNNVNYYWYASWFQVC